jgi:hypothetical protein
MARNHGWQLWYLHPDGWFASPIFRHASEAVGQERPDTLMTLLYCIDDSDGGPTVSTLFRSKDNNAVAAAIAKHGARPSE